MHKRACDDAKYSWDLRLKKEKQRDGGGVDQCETLRDGRAGPRDMSQRKTGSLFI